MANKAFKNEEIANRIVEKHGRLTARVFQKTQKFKIQKKQIIFPLDYMNEHSMLNFGLLGGREAFPHMAIHFTKELPINTKENMKN